MNAFITLACLLAATNAAVYAQAYTAGYGAAGAHSYESSNVKSAASSSSSSAAVSKYGAAGYEGAYGGYGSGAYGAASGYGGASASQYESSNTQSSLSSSAAVSKYGAAGYEGAYGGYGSGAYGAASGYGASAASQYESSNLQSSASSSTAAASNYAASGYEGAAAYGAAGYGYGGSARSASSGGYSRSASVQSTTSSSSSSSSSSASVNYASAWPALYQAPLFKTICNLGSNYKSGLIAKHFQQQSLDYHQVFNNLYSQNKFFESYVYAATGIEQNTQIARQRFFDLASGNPGTLLRIVHLYGRHPTIFNSEFAKFAFSYSSVELLKAVQLNKISYQSFFTNELVTSIARSRTYRKVLGSFYGLSESVEPTVLAQSIFRSYQTNPSGTFLLLRHSLLRRQLTDQRYYQGVNYESYLNQSSIWSRKAWLKNQYYNSYQSKYVGQRSSSYSSSSSSYSASNAAGAAGYGAATYGGNYGSYSGYGAASAGAAQKSSSVQQQSSSFQQSSASSGAAVSQGVVGAAYY